MSEEFNEGDVVKLNNTQQEAEVLEVVSVIGDEHHGALLRVNLLGVNPPMIVYYPVRSVGLVRAAEADEGKKTERGKKSEHDKKTDHGAKSHHEDKPHRGEKKLLT